MGAGKMERMDHERLDTLRIFLLGGFRISIGDEEIEIERFRLRKARSLVKLLALAPGRRLHREQMMELLWPEYDPQAPANNLNQALHAARRALDPKGISPEKYLLYENENLSLNPETTVWVDVEAFAHLAAQARREQEGSAYRAALELYAGDLLPEDPYEEWTVSRREALRQEYLSLLLELGRCYEAGGEYQAGVVGDDVEEIAAAVTEALRYCRLVVVCGGLGPTSDDRTTEAVAQALEKRLISDEEQWERIRKIFSLLRGEEPSPGNEKQARLPEGADVLTNEMGTPELPEDDCIVFFQSGLDMPLPDPASIRWVAYTFPIPAGSPTLPEPNNGDPCPGGFCETCVLPGDPDPTFGASTAK